VLAPASLRVGCARRDSASGQRDQPVPLHRRIAARRGGVEQRPVLDEQQAVDDQRRERGELGKDALGQAAGKGHGAAVVEQREPGLGLLAINREGALRDHLAMAFRQACLLGHHEPASLQPLHHRRQTGVAEAIVIGAGGGELDARAAAGLEMEGQLPDQAAEQLRLQPGRACLRGKAAPERNHRAQRHDLDCGSSPPVRFHGFGSTF
jgi:hypothetical protein